ncbi:uncharacterized protein LOC108672422 [Hyalella azteca]|uniref:Uncharacterized protein LOC108672422 n=1 Tax=Hyalella azteca TaxID=294128 RepID=A0A8B7NPB8_HYAAZ|nr:uncharacterized protein LOC108672422 [Hyalella azteca]
MFPSTIICLLPLIIGAVAADCPEGYEVVGSECIHRYTGGYLTYDEAATYCTQHSGRLPVLKDCASFIDVTSYVNDGYSTDYNNGYWLGATNGTLTNVWQWSDGAAVQMGAPYWANDPGDDLTTEPDGGTSLCQNPFVLVGTQCVHLITTNYTWHDARNQCGLVGGGLIVVDDCDQYHKVALYLAEQEPDNPGKQNCLELNCAGMYRFSSAWCSHVRRVICESDPI